MVTGRLLATRTLTRIQDGPAQHACSPDSVRTPQRSAHGGGCIDAGTPITIFELANGAKCEATAERRRDAEQQDCTLLPSRLPPVEN